MNYYVLQVMTGEESKFIELAKSLTGSSHAGEETFLWPRRKLTIRKRGKHREDLVPVFPGYIFLQAEELGPELYWGIRKTPGFVRFLKSNQNVEPVKDQDRDLLLHFLGFGEILDKSRVKFNEDNRIKVISGPMKGLEGRVIKVDKRKKRAKISLSLYEESFKIDFGFEILEKIEENEKE